MKILLNNVSGHHHGLPPLSITHVPVLIRPHLPSRSTTLVLLASRGINQIAPTWRPAALLMSGEHPGARFRRTARSGLSTCSTPPRRLTSTGILVEPRPALNAGAVAASPRPFRRDERRPSYDRAREARSATTKTFIINRNDGWACDHWRRIDV